ncbi:MAG: methanogen output domain 1-containing protein [Nanoarchaeota archaeon]|nr:methanogen output domain 1-containing protein [Nanoarchaeota archaeon]
MFNSDIERKILDFIKNRPLGVTSSDLAHYLGLNRMTIAKYLAIIKERTLVDFKQLGMAKLWYVPVTFNKTSYFNDFLIKFGAESSGEKNNVKKAAIAVAKNIEEKYKKYYGVEKLSYTQVIDSLIDAQGKISGKFIVIERTEDVIILKNTKCPFGEKVKKAPSLCATTSALCGVMSARNLGYSRVELKKTIAKGAPECLIHIYLKKTEENAEATDEYASV